MSTAKLHNLLFLKLGGSLVTDKIRAGIPRLEVIDSLTAEIKKAWSQTKNMRWVLGHGSGSFGHIPAKRYGTRQGVHSPEDWNGFVEVWYEASTLNRILMETLFQAGLPVIAFPASGSVITRDGQIAAWNLGPLTAALRAGLIPVVYGDVVFDQQRGGTILSTEDIFVYLAGKLHPRRILLAGIEKGVWADFPARTDLIPKINAKNWQAVASALGGSEATDVTGGMQTKVHTMLELAVDIPGLEVVIFSGDNRGNLLSVLQGQSMGTRITR